MFLVHSSCISNMKNIKGNKQMLVVNTELRLKAARAASFVLAFLLNSDNLLNLLTGYEQLSYISSMQILHKNFNQS